MTSCLLLESIADTLVLGVTSCSAAFEQNSVVCVLKRNTREMFAQAISYEHSDNSHTVVHVQFVPSPLRVGFETALQGGPLPKHFVDCAGVRGGTKPHGSPTINCLRRDFTCIYGFIVEQQPSLDPSGSSVEVCTELGLILKRHGFGRSDCAPSV